jgi:hypothetical protein
MKNQGIEEELNQTEVKPQTIPSTQKEEVLNSQEDNTKEKIVDKSGVENDQTPIKKDGSDGTNEWSVSWP